MKLTRNILFIAALLVLSIISNGQYTLFFAIWIFTSVLLFAVRRLKRWQGFLFAFVTIGIGYYVGFNVVPFLPVIASVIIAAIFSLFAALPYFIDSFFTKRRASFWSTLIFPCAAVLLEYTYHMINQYGSWGHMAYTQQSQTILVQSISVFGMGYITFLVTWFASVSNWLYEQRNNSKLLKRGALIYGAVLGLTLIFGTYRVAYHNNNSETVRIASISAPDELNAFIDLKGLNNEETADNALVESRKRTSKVNNYLFDKSVAEAKAGAKIVFWAEGNGVILKQDEEELYQQASKIATQHNFYLGLGIAVIDPTKGKFLENKFVMFDKNGEKVMDYWKGISVPGAEASISNNKATGIPKIETEYGTIAGVICFDLDFPNYIKQAGGSDILLAPSNDWKEIDPIHTDMARFRAIEQGFNFIRQTSHGLSAGSDATGKVLSEMDHFTDTDKVMVTHLPTKGTKTIYASIGDSFIVFSLLLLISATIVLRKRKNATSEKIEALENEKAIFLNDQAA